MKLVLPVALTWAAFAFYLLPGAVDQEIASGSTRSGAADAPSGSEPLKHIGIGSNGLNLYQGKGARWWARRAVQARKDANARGRTIRRLQHAQLRSSAHFFSWLQAADCVQGKEARWDYDGPTYDGGMQADALFQRSYAPDLLRRYGKPAYAWPWYAQLQMAYRGWLFRAWEPWPNTARACGLR